MMRSILMITMACCLSFGCAAQAPDDDVSAAREELRNGGGGLAAR